jgi:hypothetical protein
MRPMDTYVHDEAALWVYVGAALIMLYHHGWDMLWWFVDKLCY